MLNPITFTVEAESGPLTVTAGGSDYAAYEDRFDKPIITAMAGGQYRAYVFLVWHAMHRQKLTELTYEEFLDTTPQFHSPESVEEIVPLESTAPIG
jgi:hypothetical protein